MAVRLHPHARERLAERAGSLDSALANSRFPFSGPTSTGNILASKMDNRISPFEAGSIRYARFWIPLGFGSARLRL